MIDITELIAMVRIIRDSAEPIQTPDEPCGYSTLITNVQYDGSFNWVIDGVIEALERCEPIFASVDHRPAVEHAIEVLSRNKCDGCSLADSCTEKECEYKKAVDLGIAALMRCSTELLEAHNHDLSV